MMTKMLLTTKGGVKSLDTKELQRIVRKWQERLGLMDWDIVHKLIHVRLWAIDFEMKGAQHICKEQSIDWIAKALTQLDRRG